MSSRRTLGILGTTGAGKTTWLGAIVDGLIRGVTSRVAFDSWPDDTEGLYRAAERLQGGEFPLHTSAEQRSVLELPLRMASGSHEGTAFTLTMSDYDGEFIESLFRDRTQGWSDAWRRRARAESFLVLLRHDPESTKALRKLRSPRNTSGEKTLRDPLRSSAPTDIFSDPLPDRALPETSPAGVDDPRYVPTSLAIVELLQWIRHERGLLPGEIPEGEQRMRVGILLTAWDAIDPRWQRKTPESFLAEHHPLLRDFLASNFDDGDVRVFAISSTGGNLKEGAFREHYLASEESLSRVYWGDSKTVSESADLSLPICWALFGDDELTV